MSSPRSEIPVVINGESSVVAEGTSVAELVAAMVESPRGVAVAINAQVVPRSAWHMTILGPGDRIELLTAAQGG